MEGRGQAFTTPFIPPPAHCLHTFCLPFHTALPHCHAVHCPCLTTTMPPGPVPFCTVYPHAFMPSTFCAWTLPHLPSTSHHSCLPACHLIPALVLPLPRTMTVRTVSRSVASRFAAHFMDMGNVSLVHHTPLVCSGKHHRLAAYAPQYAHYITSHARLRTTRALRARARTARMCTHAPHTPHTHTYILLFCGADGLPVCALAGHNHKFMEGNVPFPVHTCTHTQPHTHAPFPFHGTSVVLLFF